jgi:serine/threonine protein kinase
MEYFSYGDLQNYLLSPILEGEVQQITSQVLEGLSFMHDNGFVHRDLKPTVSISSFKTPMTIVALPALSDNSLLQIEYPREIHRSRLVGKDR